MSFHFFLYAKKLSLQNPWKQVTAQSDIYSLGKIYYEVFSGEILNQDDEIQLEKVPIRIRNIISTMLESDNFFLYAKKLSLQNPCLYSQWQVPLLFLKYSAPQTICLPTFSVYGG